MPELNKDLLLRAQESRPKAPNTFVIRTLTAAAAVVLIVLSLSSLFAPILKPNIDDIGNDPHTVQQPNNPTQDETDNTAQQPQENPEIPEGFFFNPSGIGSWAYMTLIVSAVYFTVRVFRKAKRRETAHMLLTEIGFLVYIIALVVLAYRSMIGSFNLGFDVDGWASHCDSGLRWNSHGQQLYPAIISLQGAYAKAFVWSIASAVFTASLVAAYSWLRKKWAMLLAFTVVLLAPWAWKVCCVDMTAADWLSLKLLVFGIIPLAAALTLLVTPVKRQLDRYAQWCSRFEDANAYGRLAQGFWWVFAAAAVINLFIGSWWGGQQITKFTADIDVQYGLPRMHDEAWLEEVNETYVLYKEQQENSGMGNTAKGIKNSMYISGGDQRIRNKMLVNTDDIFENSSWRVENVVRLMYEHGIDELTPEMFMMIEINANLETARSYEDAFMTVQLDSQPIDVMFNGPSSGSADEGIYSYYIYIVDPSWSQTNGLNNGVNIDLTIRQYRIPALDFHDELYRFAVPEAYTAQFRFGLEGGSIIPEDTNAKNTVDILRALLFVIGLVLVCVLIDFLGGIWRRRRKKETYIEDEEDAFVDSPRRIMRIIRRCLAAVLLALLFGSWYSTIGKMSGISLPGIGVAENIRLFIFGFAVEGWISNNAVVIGMGMLISAGLLWSIDVLLTPHGARSRHWLLSIFLCFELLLQLLHYQTVMVDWMCVDPWFAATQEEALLICGQLRCSAVVIGFALLLAICASINSFGRFARVRKEKKKKESFAAGTVDTLRRIMRIIRRCLAAVMIIMLVSSWLVIIAGLRGNELFGRDSTWYMGFISFRGNLVLGIRNMPVLSAIAAVCFAIVPTYGLIYSIYQLISPRREGSRHWFLLAFLSYELFFQTCMWLLGVDDASAQEIARVSRIMMPTAVMTGAAWILTLIQNIYYKTVDR